ncbi:MAG TPA: hypothetical protein PL187_09850, partial [Caldilinea sp.]|nr:hypothetical protein [Caldilinea sp.]
SLSYTTALSFPFFGEGIVFVTEFYGNHRRWCYYLLRSISKTDHSAKSAVPGVDRKDLHDIYVVRPSETEQAKISGFLDSHLLDLDNVMRRVEKEIDLMREYRTRLIADVVTGKVDVRAVAAALPAELDEPGEPLDEAEAEEADLDDAPEDDAGEEE